MSVGIAPTKTLAKMASHFAKKHPGYNHCCIIDTDERRIKASRLYPIDEVWGIGRRYAARLNSMGINTAHDFASHSATWINSTFRTIVVERTNRQKISLDKPLPPCYNSQVIKSAHIAE